MVILGGCLDYDKGVALELLKSRKPARARKAKSKPQASRSSYDSDDDSEHLEESHDNTMEAEAVELNFDGDELFDRGEYIRARDKFREALDSSKERGPRRTYARNLLKAQGEIDARERFREGNRLFMLGRYREAGAQYQTAYNLSDVNGKRRIYGEHAERARHRARIEECAMQLNFEGNDLYNDGRFEDAIRKYELAVGTSQVDESIQIYRSNIANARREIDVVNLNSQGNDLFDQGRFREALNEYQLACQESQVQAQIDKYKSNVAKAQVEVDALEYNSQGHDFLNQGRYNDAIRMYQLAQQKTNVNVMYEKYQTNVDRAEAEADADFYNSQGNNLFKEGKYTAALSKYQMACSTSQRDARMKIYRANLAKAQVEIEALNLNAQGDSFFNVGRYNDAVRIYLEAHAKTKVSAQSQKYKANADRAKVEVDAANFNSQGDNFFNEGKFNDALSKYQLAGNTSQIAAQIQKYRVNIAKAQVEIDALKLNSEGDNFFNQGRYNDAARLYLEANKKSKVTAQKNAYLSKKNKVQDIIDKLNMLDTLWEQAWGAESDTENDRSEEAKDLFQRVLSESERNLQIFPGNSKFEQYKALAVLKMEGNEIFNQGLEPQQNGIILLRAAVELNQQEKYEQANKKFKEAKTCFQSALEKYETGSKSDQRFVPCVGFVQEQINEVIRSMTFCEQRMLSAGLQNLDIKIDSGTQRSDTDTRRVNESGSNKQYSQHI